jgi:hypothetical protein
VNRKPHDRWTRRTHWWITGAAALALCWAGSATAQTSSVPGVLAFGETQAGPTADSKGKPAAGRQEKQPAVGPAVATKDASRPADRTGQAPPAEGDIIQTSGCSACNGGLLRLGSRHHDHGGRGPGGCGPGCGPGCGSYGCCTPGREGGSICNHDTFIGRCICGLYECVCCPDPCYEPRWIAAANAAFFVDGARPITHMRIRWDSGLDLTRPDRAEFFWAKIGGGGPGLAESGVRYNDVSLYTETAAGNFAFFVDIPYRTLEAEVNNDTSGFGDINLGTKALLFDCELLQVTFQFRTYLPAGNAGKGLGTGHVSLEPSLLFAVKLARDAYLQAQVSEWIPIGGDAAYAGAVLHYHFSLNYVLWRFLPDVPLIGTLEMNGYSFQDGLFTDPVLGPFQRASGETYVSLGPGLRLVVCDKLDIGVGTAFDVTDRGGPEQIYRTEFRWRF